MSTPTTLVAYLARAGIDWAEATVRASAPLVQEKIEKLSQYPDFARFLFEPVVDLPAPTPTSAAPRSLRFEPVEPWEASRIEEALRALAEQLGQKPRQAFAPIRLAVTGSKISPGLFESLELLGKDESLARLSAAAAG